MSRKGMSKKRNFFIILKIIWSIYPDFELYTEDMY